MPFFLSTDLFCRIFDRIVRVGSDRAGSGCDGLDPTRTIAQNIAYGATAAGNGATAAAAPPPWEKGELPGGVAMERVVQAAEFANAKDFVEGFPDG